MKWVELGLAGVPAQTRPDAVRRDAISCVSTDVILSTHDPTLMPSAPKGGLGGARMWVGGYRPHLRTPAPPHGSRIALTSEHHRPHMEVVSPSPPNTIAPTWKSCRPYLRTLSPPQGSRVAPTSEYYRPLMEVISPSPPDTLPHL